jgi:FkbM family methyltransferase
MTALPMLASAALRKMNKPYYLLRPSQIVRRAILPLHRRDGRDTLDEIVSPWGLPLKFRSLDKTGLCYARRGIFDLPVCETLWRLADPGELALDVGANIGQMTSVLATAVADAGRVISFEPHPEIFSLLAENTMRWNAARRTGRIEPRPVAVGAVAGTARLAMSADFDMNIGTASIVGAGDEAARSIEVEIQRLDDEFPDADIGVMKVDVEGHELDVFQGADRLLRSHRIRDIVFEEFGEPPTPVTRLLGSYGYAILSLDQALLGPVAAPARGNWQRNSTEDPSYLATTDMSRAMNRLRSRGWGVLGAGSTRLRRSFVSR